MKVINLTKKKLFTREHQESYGNANVCYICKEKFQNKCIKDNKYCKVRDHCHYARGYRGATHSICNLKHCVPKS